MKGFLSLSNELGCCWCRDLTQAGRTTSVAHDVKQLVCGVDVGSTTVKIAVVPDGVFSDTSLEQPVFCDYVRHNAQIGEALAEVLERAGSVLNEAQLRVTITGSAGMGLSERLHVPFVQEVVAAADLVQALYPDAQAICDIGGEDSKLVLFDERGRSDIRMNGSCAGGTGAFIDQMAMLIQVPIAELSDLAESADTSFPIASRCGVFAKTDVQNLLSQGASEADIAASVLDAVALQTVNALARGRTVDSNIVLSGGPLTFMPYLKRSLLRCLGLGEADAIVLQRSELLSAFGAAFAAQENEKTYTVSELLTALKKPLRAEGNSEREQPLFASEDAFHTWNQTRFTPVPRCKLEDIDGVPCTLGIDSGSTTTKMVLADDDGRIAFTHYTYSRGDHIGAVRSGLKALAEAAGESGVTPHIIGTAVTGYGEDLIRTAFQIDQGIVETLAHFRAASELAPDVSFILDIGGQDMKAMYIDNGAVSNIEVNEACSSGCGSFIQTFAEILGRSVEEFARGACASSAPCALGSRCTVFMNSRVKQFLREGAAVDDIAAGLAYSVIRNCLTKVLKIRDMDQLGDTVVVQGGTFLNPAIQRAFENLTGKRIICPDVAGLTGAYGCALVARDTAWENAGNSETSFDLVTAVNVPDPERKRSVCKGCSNRCTVTTLRFGGNRKFYSGNRCERVFSNSGTRHIPGEDHSAYKEQLLFDRPHTPQEAPLGRIGIPRALNVYENYPFWCTFLVELGYEVVLSDESSASLYQKGAGTIMSDSICFPAKLVHGHVIDLIEKGVDTILYPQVVYEEHEYGSLNCYNCPIVSGYPDVIRSAIDPEDRHGVPFLTPVVNFADRGLLERTCRELAISLRGTQRGAYRALQCALDEQQGFRAALIRRGEEVVQKAKEEGRTVVMLLERPYHLDHLINQGVPRMLADLGMDVLLTDFASDQGDLSGMQVLTQWAYPNRLYNAARYAAVHDHVELLQINSFGCGPDALATDELVELLREHGKHLTVIRVDETASPGSIRLRLRTMSETMRLRNENDIVNKREKTYPAVFMPCDRHRKILVPSFSTVLNPIVTSEFASVGYEFEVLPPSDALSQEYGLRYVNNEVCYPAIMTIGDILKALDSGKYNLDEVAAGITQTGGQCRASSYLGLMGKALVSAGFGNVPLVGIHLTSRSLHYQPGFELNKTKLVKRALFSIIVSDAIAMMERALRVREETPGAASKLASDLMDEWTSGEDRSRRRALSFLRDAVARFNRIPARSGTLPRVGVVGEIYVKYGAFSNRNVVDWLIGMGVDVVIPQLAGFFLQELGNTRYKAGIGLTRRSVWWALTPLFESLADGFLNRVNDVLSDFPYTTPFSDLDQMAQNASEVLNLANQYGEGWLIAGEMIELAHHGVENVLCLQPFGCIANQVVAKGIETRLRKLHPEIGVLFVDLDHNTSEANMYNRIHFLVKNARTAAESGDLVPAAVPVMTQSVNELC